MSTEGQTTPTSSTPGGSTSHHSTTHHHHHSNQAVVTRAAAPNSWFPSEIQQMMHGFGDCRKPLLESATLIEEIVRQQMTRLLEQAEDVARQRNTRFIGIEDFLFLLRRDKIKLRRLIRYMDVRDLKSVTLKGTNLTEEEEVNDQESKMPMKKRRKICYEFLSSIDQTGELVSLLDDTDVDEVKHERALRAELQSHQMDSQQYKEYCEARQASFTPRYKTQKFKDWLMQGVALDIKPNPLAVEVLSYLAFETVAQVVDLALIARHDTVACADNPFSQLMPPVCINHDSLPAFQAAAAAGATSLKSPTSRATSPATSPPSTPTTPTQSSQSSGFSQTSASSSSSFKSKSKKKKKSGNPPSRDIYSSQAIFPKDIREAMRRYSQCIGPFADFSKAPQNPGRHRLLCT